MLRRLWSWVVMTFSTLFFARSSRSFGNASLTASGMSKRACFGAGCYWGTEKFLKKDFGIKVYRGSGLVVDGKVGFMGPPTAPRNPTYEQVCTGSTGHVEVYDFRFEGDEGTYELLVRHFFMFHDPTTLNRQGFDMGSQYASTIFVYDEQQREIATRVRNELQRVISNRPMSGYAERKLSTTIVDAGEFFPAHDEHQAYLQKNPGGYCNHYYRFTQWPSSIVGNGNDSQ